MAYSGPLHSVTAFGMNEHISYSVRVSSPNELTTVIPAAIFRFTITVVLRNAPRSPILYTRPNPIHSQIFFQEGASDFLRPLLSRLSSHTLFGAETVDRIVEMVASAVRDIIQVDADAPSSSTSQPPQIPVSVEITVTDNTTLAARQDSATLGFGMVPASQEAIEKLLKKTRVVKTERCSICLEELVVDDECCILPCHHCFHENCILDWLHTGHTFPLCRYPVQTLKIRD